MFFLSIPLSDQHPFAGHAVKKKERRIFAAFMTVENYSNLPVLTFCPSLRWPATPARRSGPMTAASFAKLGGILPMAWTRSSTLKAARSGRFRNTNSQASSPAGGREPVSALHTAKYLSSILYFEIPAASLIFAGPSMASSFLILK